MDRLDKPLDDLVKDSRAAARGNAKKVGKKAVAAKKKPVKATGSKKAVTVGKAKLVLKKQKLVLPTAKNILDRVGVSSKPKVPKQSGSPVVFSNLAYNITMDEMKELCSTIGPCGKVIMDVKGKADVMFFNRLDAITAVKKFNGLTLDGRPMQVTMKESTVSKRPQDPTTSKALLFGSQMGSRGGGRNSATSFTVTLGGSNKQQKKPKTTVMVKQAAKKKAPKKEKPKKEAPKPKSSDDLNMEMDSYFANRPTKATS